MLGREPNYLELAMIDAEWSEHCSYKSSKPVLKQLPTKGPRVIIGPGYDAGVIDVDDGYVVTLHIESHNHPSAIDPYGGAATGIGGVLRDILCMGTRPIALLNSLRFGNIEESAHSRWLFKHVVRGISDYGNCVGVPTVSGEVEFDDCFERNCLVDVICLGLGKINDLVLAEAKHPGDSVILVGGSTGRDGIHGVTFASRVLTEKSDEERSAVQIPDPFMKKLIVEATLEAIATGHVRGLKDLGGGGLTCGLSEMADKGGCGIDVELSRVHLREKNLNPIETMISESQERMVFIIEQGYEKEVCEIFDKYELPYSIIGRVTDSSKLIVKMDGLELANLPVKTVANAPIIHRKAIEPDYIKNLKFIEKPVLPSNLSSVLLKMLSCPSIASKSWVYEQYDHEVGIRTVVKPGQGDAAVLRLPNGTFLAIKVDGNSKHCYIDPYNGAAGCLAEACRNLVSVGAEPIAFVDHLQFGDPGNPEVFWTFSESVRGLADYSKAIGLPCIGGKVSFYNEDKVKNMAIKPSPVIAAIGRIEKQDWITKMNFKHDGNYIIVLGETKSEMGGSEYYEYIHGLVGGVAPKIDFIKENATMYAVIDSIRKGLVKAVHDVSKGGIAIALAEMCISGNIGASIDCSNIPAYDLRIDELLFSETHSRFIIETDSVNMDDFLGTMKRAGVAYNVIGKVGGEALKFSYKGEELISIPISDLKDRWLGAIPKCMGEN
ncbi:MAG: phosphoribosylformylglycinamidine synthase subunit PurL [archaeon]|nr:phosphoribosylformylglycinamidine synthase subunit PurL [archaeon]MCP8314259.1 phosphoribosylformylglycinamidine synthase subunit PurL [archaeon]